MLDEQSPATCADIVRIEGKIDTGFAKIDLLFSGTPGNGNVPGVIRQVDRNTGFRNRVTWWAKVATASVCCPLLVAAFMALGAWFLGML